MREITYGHAAIRALALTIFAIGTASALLLHDSAAGMLLGTGKSAAASLLFLWLARHLPTRAAQPVADSTENGR